MKVRRYLLEEDEFESTLVLPGDVAQSTFLDNLQMVDDRFAAFSVNIERAINLFDANFNQESLCERNCFYQ